MADVYSQDAAYRPGPFFLRKQRFGTSLVVHNTGSTLSAPSNGADMLIVSHSAPDFLAASEAWANYRRSPAGGGFNVKVVDVADIFDEFSYGVLSADAIHNFLAVAHDDWALRPRYLLFIGDSTYDPRNYEGQGNWDLVPTRIGNTFYGETGSDGDCRSGRRRPCELQ